MAKFYTNVMLRRNYIYLRGYDMGLPIQEKVEYKPYLFMSTSKPSMYKTLDGQQVDKINFDDVTEAKKFLETYKDVTGVKIYGLNNFLYTYIYDTFKGAIDYDASLINVVIIDIEVASDEGFPDIQSATKPITAITLRRRNRSYIIGCGDYKPKDSNVYYVKCENEEELLRMFIQTWNSLNPDIVTGWNIEFFDIPYLVNRITNLIGSSEANKLSPWKILDERTIELNGRSNQVFLPAGISILDYLHLYKKFSFGNHESYRLDFIANLELGEKKLDYSEYESLLDLYKKDYQKFIDYNNHDCVLVDRLEDKLGFIKQVMALAYDAKVNYNDTLTTVRPWDVIIHNYLLDKNIVIPQFTPSSNDTQIMGGYVKEVKPGMYKWVVSFDLNSLYPHLIMQYNISPETFVGKLNVTPSIDELLNQNVVFGAEYQSASGVAYTANGTYYRRDKQGFLAELMETMYNDRTKYKKLMIEAKKEYEKTKNKELEKDISRYHNMQMAKKIQLNSAYGALANQYFRWFNNDLAEAITSSGQLSIRWIERKMNTFMNKTLKTNDVDYVIASDTDSIYITMERMVKHLNTNDDHFIVGAIDAFCEKVIQPKLDEWYQELADYMNAHQQRMEMKRECIANKGIWTAKKRYILNVYNQEGVAYTTPKLKIQGIEAVRSSTPLAIRNKIKTTLEVIMNKSEEDVIDFINEFKEEFKKLPFEEVAFPRGVNGLNKYKDSSSIYKKATPMHVKGALIFNHLVNKMNLKQKYQLINDGDKIKFSYLIMPNPVRDTVISTPGILPSQFGLDQYIDYDMQFEKGYLQPIKSILDAIGWDTEKRSTLEGFFE